MGLTLAEQTLLIALDDEKGRDTTRWGSDAGLAGALLLDLARLELVGTDAGGKIAALAGIPPGHELLRDVYTTIARSSKRRDAKAWVERLPHDLTAAAQASRPRARAARHPLRGALEGARDPTQDAVPDG